MRYRFKRGLKKLLTTQYNVIGIVSQITSILIMMETYNTLQSQAYQYLKKRIFSRLLTKGKLYSETQIAKEIGLSRTPLRGALQQLQRDKLVEILPNRGFKIWEMSEKDITETYQVRAAIEGYAVIQIARAQQSESGKKVITVLRKIHISQMALLKEPLNIDLFTKTDQRFQEMMVNNLHNQSLSELFNSVYYRIQAICISTFQVPNRPKDALKEHAAIIEALSNGEEHLAYTAILDHLENVKNVMIAMLEDEFCRKKGLG
jgi:DNA-binding GntR family transcriptional regulator